MPSMAHVGAYMIPSGVVLVQCPLGAYRSSGIKLPYLVGGGYVDVEPAQDVQLVVGDRKATRQNCSHGTRPVVSTAKVVAVSVAGL